MQVPDESAGVLVRVEPVVGQVACSLVLLVPCVVALLHEQHRKLSVATLSHLH